MVKLKFHSSGKYDSNIISKRNTDIYRNPKSWPVLVHAKRVRVNDKYQKFCKVLEVYYSIFTCIRLNKK